MNNIIECNFCGKSTKEVNRIIAGGGVYICNECVNLCNEILNEEKKGVKKVSKDSLPTPKQIYEHLNEYIVGQEEAKKALSVAVYNHYKRLKNSRRLSDKKIGFTGDDEDGVEKDVEDVEIAKSNILLIGPTGTGKTYLAKTLAKIIDVPFAIADATALTEAGFAGDDIESIVMRLLQAANGDVEKAETGIIYIDEIDKIAKRVTSNEQRDISGEGVQQSLLKLIEGCDVILWPQAEKPKKAQKPIHIDTSNILFIVAGAFDKLEDIIAVRKYPSKIGFGASINLKDEKERLLREVETSDLYEYGFIPEFVGRLPIITTVNKLSIDDLKAILTAPKNSLVKQYGKLFELDGVKLTFDQDALEEMANMALEQKTGARGLRTIVERILGSVMFEIPSDKNISEVIVTKDCVVKGKSPKIIKKQ